MLSDFIPSRRTCEIAGAQPAEVRGERLHRVAGGVDVFGEARARPPVIAKRFEGRGGNRVDGIGADQLFDVKNVAVGRVFRARAGPQQTLGLGPVSGQRLPAPSAEEH